MKTRALPDDDTQAAYFGLCTLALAHIAWMQDLGLLAMPDGTAVIENDAVDRIARECRERGFDYSSDTIAEKGWELIRQWAGFYDVLPESATPDR